MSSLKCPECNLMNFATAISCSRCGYHFKEVKRPMPPIRAGGTMTNINAHAGAMANVKIPPPQVSPNTNTNYQQPLAKSNLLTSQQNSNPQIANQQSAKPPHTQFQQQNSPQVSNQSNGVMSNSAEKNVAIAELALEANSAGLAVKILMLPFTIVRKIAGFLYSHKKVVALVLAPPAIAVMVGPNLLEAIKSANENSAIATIKVINQAQMTFITTKQRCGELKELEQGQLIDASVANGTKSGYIFVVSKLPGGCEVHAKPTEIQGLTATGNRSFYFSTRDNTLRVSNDKKVVASVTSPAFDVGGDMKQEGEKPKIAQAK